MGHVARMASGSPLRPSQHTMKVSWMPRLRSSVNKLIQLFWRACQGFVGARVRCAVGVSMWSPAGRQREGGPGAVRSQVGAVVVLADVFAIADRGEPGVLLDTQSV